MNFVFEDVINQNVEVKLNYQFDTYKSLLMVLNNKYANFDNCILYQNLDIFIENFNKKPRYEDFFILDYTL